MTLRPLEPEDLDLLYTIENDPELWETSYAEAPYSRFALKQYIAEKHTLYSSGEFRLIIEILDVATQRPKAIGIVDLTNYSPLAARAEIGIALLKEYRQQGYGSKAIKLVERLAHTRFHIHSLHAYVSPGNTSSYRLFSKNGYTVVATLPDWHFSDGKYEDMALFYKNLEK